LKEISYKKSYFLEFGSIENGLQSKASSYKKEILIIFCLQSPNPIKEVRGT
jgi:hypothetical protein